MKVEIPAALEPILREAMEKGEHGDFANTIAAALWAWNNDQWAIDDWWDEMDPEARAEFLASLAEAQTGPAIHATPEYFESLRERVRVRAAERHSA